MKIGGVGNPTLGSMSLRTHDSTQHLGGDPSNLRFQAGRARRTLEGAFADMTQLVEALKGLQKQLSRGSGSTPAAEVVPGNTGNNRQPEDPTPVDKWVAVDDALQRVAPGGLDRQEWSAVLRPALEDAVGRSLDDDIWSVVGRRIHTILSDGYQSEDFVDVRSLMERAQERQTTRDRVVGTEWGWVDDAVAKASPDNLVDDTEWQGIEDRIRASIGRDLDSDLWGKLKTSLDDLVADGYDDDDLMALKRDAGKAVVTQKFRDAKQDLIGGPIAAPDILVVDQQVGAQSAGVGEAISAIDSGSLDQGGIANTVGEIVGGGKAIAKYKEHFHRGPSMSKVKKHIAKAEEALKGVLKNLNFDGTGDLQGLAEAWQKSGKLTGEGGGALDDLLPQEQVEALMAALSASPGQALKALRDPGGGSGVVDGLVGDLQVLMDAMESRIDSLRGVGLSMVA